MHAECAWCGDEPRMGVGVFGSPKTFSICNYCFEMQNLHGEVFMPPTNDIVPTSSLPPTLSAEVVTETHHEALQAQQAVEQLRQFVVETPTQIEVASKLLQDVHNELKRVTERKEEITKPMNAALKSIRDLFRPAENAYAEAKDILKDKIGRAQHAIREANRLAALATQQALAQGDVRQAALTSGAIVATSAPAGIAYREQFTFRITNASILPREFLMPNEAAIRAHVAKHGLASNIPGVTVEQQVAVNVTGRRG